MNRKTVHAALIALLFVSLPALAQVYTWKDDKGRTIVSDKPQPGSKAKGGDRPASSGAEEAPAPAAAPPQAAKASADGANKAGVDPEIEKRKKDQEARVKAEAEQKANALKAQKEADCKANRANLAVLESGQRLVQRDASGERVFMDDSARASEITRVRGLLADCAN
jgi:hypothetical protein